MEEASVTVQNDLDFLPSRKRSSSNKLEMSSPTQYPSKVPITQLIDHSCIKQTADRGNPL